MTQRVDELLKDLDPRPFASELNGKIHVCAAVSLMDEVKRRLRDRGIEAEFWELDHETAVMAANETREPRCRWFRWFTC
jgi:hypothetical protein